MLLLDDHVDTMTDQELLARYLQDGDNDCFEELYDRYYLPLHGYLGKDISAHEIDDVIQNVWLKVYMNGQKYDPDRGSVFNWVMQIAQNEQRQYLRASIAKCRNNGEPQVSLDAEDDELGFITDDVSLQIVDPHPAPDFIEEEEQSQLVAQLSACLAGLADAERDVIQLLYYESLTLREAGERLGVSRMYVKRMSESAMKKLRENMGVVLEEVSG